ncbi:hypothetical protein [Halomonas sp.]|uniref:hypothetical protein n=1 Tax=Halomonas sp. TaxID=1486246 RepID=UPI0038514D1D
MQPDQILTELGIVSIEEAAEDTRYAMKQAGAIGTVLDTGLGYLRLTSAESAEVQAFVRRLLELRLVKLEGGRRHV